MNSRHRCRRAERVASRPYLAEPVGQPSAKPLGGSTRWPGKTALPARPGRERRRPRADRRPAPLGRGFEPLAHKAKIAIATRLTGDRRLPCRIQCLHEPSLMPLQARLDI